MTSKKGKCNSNSKQQQQRKKASANSKRRFPSGMTSKEKDREATTGLEAEGGGELHLAGGELVGDAGQGGAEACGGGGAFAVGAAVAYDVAVVEGVEGFCAEVEVKSFVEEGKGAAYEGVYGVQAVASASVAAYDGAVEDGSVGGGACVSAVGVAGDEVVGQAGGEGAYAAEVDF